MNSGRMTFRFDNGKVKPDELQPESGPEAQGKEEQEEVRRERIAEIYSLDEVRQAYPGSRPGRAGKGNPPYTSPAAEYRLEELEQAYKSRRTGGSPEADRLKEPFLRSKEPEPPSYADFDYGSPAYSGNGGYPEPPEDREPGVEWLDDGDDTGGYYTTRRSSSWWKFPASVAGAIAIGLMLGYAALNYFSGSTGTSGNASSPDTAVEQRAAGDLSGPSAVPVQVAARTYYLLQYGVFSTPQGAEQAKSELEAAGLAAGLSPDNDNRVYAGLSPDREQAKLLGERLKAQGIEPYLKEVTLPAESALRFNGDGEAVSRYFEASGRLLGELSSVSASLLSGSNGADISGISDLHLQWSEALKSLEAGLPAEAQSAAKDLEKSVSQGVAAVNEYGKSRADGLLWEVQSSMLDMLSGEKKLLAAMEQG